MRDTTRYDQLRIQNSPAQTGTCHRASQPKSSTAAATASPSLSFFTRPGSPILTNSHLEGSLINHARCWINVGKKLINLRRCLIDMLPDDALLIIFDFCANGNNTNEGLDAWQPLVHVCRRWRSVVFGSPRRLKLRLTCTSRTPARDMPDVWPVLPLAIRCIDGYSMESVDNIVALLEHSNRVCQIELFGVSSLHFEKISAAMQEPFPELTNLQLSLDKETVAVLPLPDSFLGGCSPHLRNLYFRGIPFPGLPKLLLSATHLVTLSLHSIPHSGYFSPQAMVTALSTFTSLGSLELEFQSPLSCPASRRPPPLTRSVLPILSYFSFKGVSEYLDDLVARIDAPQLKFLDATFFNQILFETQQTIQFISRTPKLDVLEKAKVFFKFGAASVKLISHASGDEGLKVNILCEGLDWQVSSLEQVCTSCLPPLSKLEDLYIDGGFFREPYRQDNPENWLWLAPSMQDKTENSLWLELLQPFTAVKNLYLSYESASRIERALQEVGTTEVLPALRKIFLDSSVRPHIKKGIGRFVATRRATGHPISVSGWDAISF